MYDPLMAVIQQTGQTEPQLDPLFKRAKLLRLCAEGRAYIEGAQSVINPYNTPLPHKTEMALAPDMRAFFGAYKEMYARYDEEKFLCPVCGTGLVDAFFDSEMGLFRFAEKSVHEGKLVRRLAYVCLPCAAFMREKQATLEGGLPVVMPPLPEEEEKEGDVEKEEEEGQEVEGEEEEEEEERPQHD